MSNSFMSPICNDEMRKETIVCPFLNLKPCPIKSIKGFLSWEGRRGKEKEEH